MERVTGIGGVSFGAKDPAVLSRWYADHLGVEPAPPAIAGMPWQQDGGPTLFSPTEEPGWTLAFRVRDLDAMITQLRADGIPVDVDSEVTPHGRFASLTDPEGNPVRLWEPSPDQLGSA
jgi:catechol 2,3-dioxygenase-like lactoylglutathione lyase family enzyme